MEQLNNALDSALDKEELQGQLIIKAIGDESDTHYFFEGYGNVFNIRDYSGHITLKGAFEKSIQRHAASGVPLPMLWNHDQGNQIGSWVEMYEDDYGLYMKGRLTKGVQQAETVYKLMKGGDLSGLSIGVWAKQKQMQDGSLMLIELDLFETSVVSIPANYQSRVTLVKSMLNNNELPSISQVEKALREIGFSRSQSKVLLSLGYKGLLPEAEQEIETVEVVETEQTEQPEETSAMLETETVVETEQTEQLQETVDQEDINTKTEAETSADENEEVNEEVQKSLNELTSILKSLKI
ncbi:HK97 family phage prohead protease [Aeromonas caviae]|uniref:HK97 family phage prohead protease n=1 Tax=Aeromonas caviae TaxID=648 RepID=UPI00225A180B|nr:HK97 family phage prohead protease [Aeromonas caviae]MCX4071939.1 HK97 family phage prohead protease [Aeromonas caviae]